jgi:addiction module HigA family antidote
MRKKGEKRLLTRAARKRSHVCAGAYRGATVESWEKIGWQAEAPAPRNRRKETAAMRMLNPPHPGDFIRTEIIEPQDLSVTAAARVLQVSRPALSSLLNGKADLSGDMALRIEKAFGVKMDTLMRMQASYDIARARKRESIIRVRRFEPGVGRRQ